MLDEKSIEILLEHAHRRSYPAKQVIVHAGDEPTSLYYIVEGSVRVLLEDEEGREIVLTYLNAGEFFGEMCLFPELKTRSALVMTRAESVIAEIGYEPFRKLSHEHPELIYHLAGQLALRLRDTSQRVGDLAFLDVAGRVAHTLLGLCQQPDVENTLEGTIVKISRQELARIVGCSREMAGRVLKSLEEDGIIEVHGRKILVLGRHPGEPIDEE